MQRVNCRNSGLSVRSGLWKYVSKLIVVFQTRLLPAMTCWWRYVSRVDCRDLILSPDNHDWSVEVGLSAEKLSGS